MNNDTWKIPALGWASFVGFLACIPIANWLIGNVGTTCVPNGPCLIPILPGIDAPSGVLMIGIALVLRDLVQRHLDLYWALTAIIVGLLLSIWVAPPSLVFASGMAFLLAELSDLSVYTPLQKRRLFTAVILSGVVGSIVDSTVFLYLAFGSLDHWWGQFIGKAAMSLIALPVIAIIRQYEIIRSRQAYYSVRDQYSK